MVLVSWRFAASGVVAFCSSCTRRPKMVSWVIIFVFLQICKSGQTSTGQAANCPKNFDIKYGEVTWPEEAVEGSLAFFVCPEGYRPFPVPWRTCSRRGRWTRLINAYGETAREAVCKPVNCIGNVEIKDGWVENQRRQPWYKVGETLSFQCEPGFQLMGSLERTCMVNGRWNGTLPSCDRGDTYCPNPGLPFGVYQSNENYDQGSTITYSCSNPKLIMMGSRKRLCLVTREWTGNEPRCEDYYSYDTIDDVAMKLAKAQIASSSNRVDVNRMVSVGAGHETHVYFVMDASNSVGRIPFGKGVQFAKQFIDQVSAYTDTIKYGIVVFAGKVSWKKKIEVDEYYFADEIIERLANTSIHNGSEGTGGTNMGDALKEVHDHMNLLKAQYMHSNTNWTEVRHVVVLITDGRNNMGTDPEEIVKKLKHMIPDNRLDIYVFGVGDVNKEDLKKISSSKEDQQHMFIIKKYEQFSDISEKMIQAEKTTLNRCGISGKVQLNSGGVDRIFNGSDTDIFTWPWQVQLYSHLPGEDGIKQCGATIIAKNWLMTAAHCLQEDRTMGNITHDKVTIYVGNADKNKGTEIKKVEKIIIHPNFNLGKRRDAAGKRRIRSYDYDIALIKVAEMNFELKVRAVCLPCTAATRDILRLESTKSFPWERQCEEHSKQLFGLTNVMGKITGWGGQGHRPRGQVTVLQEATVRLHENEWCIREFMRNKKKRTREDMEKRITDNMICAGSIGDSCQGDSGGPLVVKKNFRWIQLGITSFGMAKCGETLLGLYTHVAKMMSWVKNTVGEDIQFI
uniref:complement factor B-like n=1 Tax=Myxine glutinosa TaxID=7769 RepID=UPI00358FB110